MLDPKALAALDALKTEIQATKPKLHGQIKATGRNFGFVVTETGEEYFLPPQQMSKVFPNDRVTFSVIETSDGKSQAELESLEESQFSTFYGVFCRRGKGQGVEPMVPGFSSWLFVPPSQSKTIDDQELVFAEVTRHPFASGKAQAKIIKSFGCQDHNLSWYRFILTQHAIPENFTEAEQEEAQRIAGSVPDKSDQPDYIDLTSIEFISIDSATTEDIDDLIYCQQEGSGWYLKVAIADAAQFIEPDSTLDKAAKDRLTTTYLPGKTLPMLPEVLCNNAISLLENQIRPALVFTLWVDADGKPALTSVEQAMVKNHHKLNYPQVSDWLETNHPPEALAERLNALAEATSALGQWRASYANKMADRADYRISVDENFEVTAINTEVRNAARDLVEEAMIATNYVVADWLKNEFSLFSTHQGFKADRESELKGLLRDYAPELAELDSRELASFCQILKSAAAKASALRLILQKRFEKAQWKTTASPHFGLGFPCYTTVTSPIRKYTDLVLHRHIKAKLSDKKTTEDVALIEFINENASRSRVAAQKIENIIRLKWLAKHTEQHYDGTIVHLTSSGLIVQLTDNGATGFVDLKKLKKPLSYDALRMKIKMEDVEFELGQQVSVKPLSTERDAMLLKLTHP